MPRYLIDKLKIWLISPARKPAVLRGARQVGKTWIVRELARLTGKQLVELNFEKQRSLAIHFESNDPATILLNLESALNLAIHPADSIKAGVEGKLRSLHQFMSEKPWKLAIRFYAGALQSDHIKTKTTTGDLNDYELISLPFYLLGQVYRLLEQA